ncbi:unnamed protein product [Lactuca virosa]|uniref:Uncharacterized protein n=1 Tax=Lactuca virosa TaxID=75947 RepID=A0AAU9PUZ6_9ASTR|nr:unnamed protein product [Lactuca virosa]
MLDRATMATATDTMLTTVTTHHNQFPNFRSVFGRLSSDYIICMAEDEIGIYAIKYAMRALRNHHLEEEGAYSLLKTYCFSATNSHDHPYFRPTLNFVHIRVDILEPSFCQYPSVKKKS